MKKFLAFIAATALSCSAVFAQDEAKPWTHGGNVGLNFSQSHFYNWSAGGQDNITGIGILQYKMNYAKGNMKWDNSIDFKLGYSYYDFDKDPLKTDDNLSLSSLYGRTLITDKLFCTAEMTFKTQSANGYDYATDSTNRMSGFFAPAYITLGLGAQWTPCKYFSLNVAPVTGKLTIVNDQTLADAGDFGVEGAEYDEFGVKTKDGKKTRWELGAQATAKLEYEIFQNVVFKSKLVVFYDYIQKSDKNALGTDYDTRFDFDWDNTLLLKVNDWLNCNVSAHLLYDEDIIPIKENCRSFLQFKEVLSVGISYNIP